MINCSRIVAILFISFASISFFYGCNGDGNTPEATCDSNNLNLCTTEEECSGAEGYWYNDTCNENEQPLTCDAEHLGLCTTEEDCTEAGGHWDNTSCEERVLISSIEFADENLANCVSETGFTYAEELTILECSNKSVNELYENLVIDITPLTK